MDPTRVTLHEQSFRNARATPSSSHIDGNRAGEELPFLWRSCCGFWIDPRSANFITAAIVTIGMLVVTSYLVIVTDPCDAGPIWGIVGSLIGYWVDAPHPRDASPIRAAGRVERKNATDEEV